jgi:pyridoxine kinase
MRQGRPAAKVLAISSQVVYGPVGNSAAVPVMQTFGLIVLALPTVLLSNHPGHGPPVRQIIAAVTIKDMLERVASHGWLNDIAAVMTGYFVDAAQVEVAADAIARLKTLCPDLIYLCDPILGDDEPGLYVPEQVARAIQTRLIPLADVMTPNRFELAWLGGAEVTGPESAVQAARRLAPASLATSIPLSEDRIATMLIGETTSWVVETRRRAHVPHGTGDLLSGLYLAHLVSGKDGREALGLTLGSVETVLDASQGRDALDLVAWLARPRAPLRAQTLEISA